MTLKTGITKAAPAKLTLSLRMCDKRNDRFNNLEALTVFLPNIADSVTARTHGDIPKQLPMAPNQRSQARAVTDDSDLVFRAWKLFMEQSSAKKFEDDLVELQFGLDKIIPVSGGLGGGSADAAATLHILNEVCGDLFSDEELAGIGAELGSDIPACVYSRSLWIRGRGETIDLIDDFVADETFALVVTPDVLVPTPKVFERYEEMGRPIDPGNPAPEFLQCYVQTFHNDLALATYELFPEIDYFKTSVESVTAKKFNMAGSGPTLFCLGEASDLLAACDSVKAAGLSEKVRFCSLSQIR